jgi:hypothetical protein
MQRLRPRPDRIAPALAAALLLAAAPLLDVGCGASESAEPRGTTDASAGSGTASASTAGANGGAAPPPPEAARTRPAILPSDAPDYPDATVIERGFGRDGRIKQVSSSGDSGEQVYGYMTRLLEAQGWTIGSKLTDAGQFAIDAAKGDRRAAVLIADATLVHTEDGRTRITVLVSP